MHLGAQPLGRLDELHGVALLRAFRHRAAGQHGHAALVGRLGPAAAGKDQVRGQEGAAGHVGMDDGQAVAQGCALECREVVVARRAGRRPMVENGQVRLLGRVGCGCHDRRRFGGSG